MAYKPRSFQDLQGQFKELTAKGIDDQMEFFLKSFIFAFNDDWKEVPRLAKIFRAYLQTAGEGRQDLNIIQASDFLQKNGLERTALQRKEEIADVDLDNDQRVSFIEYMLLHFKKMILEEYYKRIGDNCPHDLSRGGK